MDTQSSNQITLDPEAVNLAKAIRQTESGGNFQARGKSGEYGAYQFTQPTWDSYSKSHGVNVPLEQSTPEQQNEVAYKQIKEWKDQGYNVGQIASMWNSGKPDAYLDTSYKGVNKQGVTYDVPAYAKSVATAYQALKRGENIGIDPNNPSSVQDTTKPNAEGYITSADLPPPPPGEVNHTGVLGTNPNDSLIGKLTDNSLTRGLINAIPGAKTLGQYFGTSFGGDYEKIKGLFGGKDNSATYDATLPSPGEVAKASGKLIGTTLGAITTGGLLKKVGLDVTLGTGSELGSSIAKGALENYAKATGTEVSQLGKGEIVNALTEAAAKADAANQPILQGAAKQALSNYLNEQGIGSFSQLNPKIAKLLGLSWKALEVLIGGALAGAGLSSGMGQSILSGVGGKIKGILE